MSVIWSEGTLVSTESPVFSMGPVGPVGPLDFVWDMGPVQCWLCCSYGPCESCVGFVARSVGCVSSVNSKIILII